MLYSPEEARLLGVRHRHIVIGLCVIAFVLFALLLANLFQIHHSVPGPELSREALQHLQGEGIRQSVMLGLLVIILAAAVLTTHHYYSTREKLARLQYTAKAILESLSGGVLALDVEGKPQIINRRALQLLQLKPDSAFNLQTLAPRYPELAEIIQEALEKGSSIQDRDIHAVNDKGSAVVLRITISEYLDYSGNHNGIIVLIRDATRLVAMDQQLRKRDRLAAMGTLAAGVAHEIRNPLSALLLNLSLLKDEVFSTQPSKEEIDNYFDIMVAETQRLDRITGNFLQLARTGPMAKATLCVSDPLSQVIKLLGVEAREKGITFETVFPETGGHLLGDANKLEQLFLNILINAMQAMPDGGTIRISATTGSDDDGEFVDVSFADTGIGIPPENMAQLFDPYFTTRENGTGLGLAIADRIATDHGGRILVESTPGAGSTMTVRLPLAATPELELV